MDIGNTKGTTDVPRVLSRLVDHNITDRSFSVFVASFLRAVGRGKLKDNKSTAFLDYQNSIHAHHAESTDLKYSRTTYAIKYGAGSL